MRKGDEEEGKEEATGKKKRQMKIEGGEERKTEMNLEERNKGRKGEMRKENGKLERKKREKFKGE